MSLWRRRRLSPELQALHDRFLEAVAPVERAKEAVVGAVPQARYPAPPLAEALVVYRDGVLEAQSLMHAWRDDRLAESWAACDRGLEHGLAAAAKLEPEAETLGFESLVEVVQRLLDPLDAFADAEERFRDLRSANIHRGRPRRP